MNLYFRNKFLAINISRVTTPYITNILGFLRSSANVKSVTLDSLTKDFAASISRAVGEIDPTITAPYYTDFEAKANNADGKVCGDPLSSNQTSAVGRIYNRAYFKDITATYFIFIYFTQQLLLNANVQATSNTSVITVLKEIAMRFHGSEFSCMVSDLVGDSIKEHDILKIQSLLSESLDDLIAKAENKNTLSAEINAEIFNQLVAIITVRVASAIATAQALSLASVPVNQDNIIWVLERVAPSIFGPAPLSAWDNSELSEMDNNTLYYVDLYEIH